MYDDDVWVKNNPDAEQTTALARMLGREREEAP